MIRCRSTSLSIAESSSSLERAGVAIGNSTTFLNLTSELVACQSDSYQKALRQMTQGGSLNDIICGVLSFREIAFRVLSAPGGLHFRVRSSTLKRPHVAQTV